MPCVEDVDGTGTHGTGFSPQDAQIGDEAEFISPFWPRGLVVSRGLVLCESRVLERSGKKYSRRRGLFSLSRPIWSRAGTWRETELLSPQPHPLHSHRCQRNVDLQQEIRKKGRKQKQILILRCYILEYLEVKSAARCPGKQA